MNYPKCPRVVPRRPPSVTRHSSFAVHDHHDHGLYHFFCFFGSGLAGFFFSSSAETFALGAAFGFVALAAGRFAAAGGLAMVSFVTVESSAGTFSMSSLSTTP